MITKLDQRGGQLEFTHVSVPTRLDSASVWSTVMLGPVLGDKRQWPQALPWRPFRVCFWKLFPSGSLLRPQWASCWAGVGSCFSCLRTLELFCAWNALPKWGWLPHFFQVVAQMSTCERGLLWTPIQLAVLPLFHHFHPPYAALLFFMALITLSHYCHHHVLNIPWFTCLLPISHH